MARVRRAAEEARGEEEAEMEAKAAREEKKKKVRSKEDLDHEDLDLDQDAAAEWVGKVRRDMMRFGSGSGGDGGERMMRARHRTPGTRDQLGSYKR